METAIPISSIISITYVSLNSRSTRIHHRYFAKSSSGSIYHFLCIVVLTIVGPLVLFLLIIILSMLRRFTVSCYSI